MAGTPGGYTHKRGRLKGVEVRPGTVKQARTEAGLSLAGVAGRELTRAAIHLIENGKSRPSMPTLELIASRTGKPLSYFLAGDDGILGSRSALDAHLSELERMVELEQFEDAISVGSSLLGEAHDSWDLARINHWIGQCHARLRRSEQALVHIRLARQLFEQLRDSWMVVECLDWEAAALSLEQDSSALGLAEQALRRCRELDPVPFPTEARILGHIANIHVLLHNWDRAVKHYQEAIEVAGSLRDLSRMARMYQGLSIVYHELGNASLELTYSHRALALHSLLRDKASVAAAENNLGLALMRQGELLGAERQLTNSLRHLDEIGMERGKSHVLLSLAELHMVRGSVDDAESATLEAMELAERMGERLNVGLGHQYLGRVAAQRDQIAITDREFQRALAIFQDMDAGERLIECHSLYAETLEHRGETRRALEHAKLALAVSRPNLAQPLHESTRQNTELTG